MTDISHFQAQSSLYSSQVSFIARGAKAVAKLVQYALAAYQERQDLVALAHADDRILRDVNIQRQDAIRALGGHYQAPQNVKIANLDLGSS